MTNKQRDYLCSILFLIFGIFLFIQSMGIKTLMSQDVGSGFTPKIVSGAIVVCSIWKLALTVLSKKADTGSKSDDDTKGGIFTICLLAAYVLLFDSLGFLISTVVYLFLQILVLSNENNRNLPLFGIISVVAPVVVYVLFVYVIKMPLPTGPMGF